LPIRYFVISKTTRIAHIHGFCQHTKPRPTPIRLFDSIQDLIRYEQRELTICDACRRKLERMPK